MEVPSLCLIVPVYNEYKRLQIEAFCAFLESQPHIHIKFVDDASTDASKELLYEIKRSYPSQVEIVHHDLRVGKAEAIRSGMLKGLQSGNYRFFGFIDADLSVPLTDISSFAKKLNTNKQNIAFGIRTGANTTNIHRTVLRKLMGKLFRTYVQHALNFSIADSQCGAKVFASDIVPVLYQAPFKTHWLSDVEIVMRYCEHFKLSNRDVQKYIIQIPVSKFEDKPNSKVTLFELLRTLKELVIITINA